LPSGYDNPPLLEVFLVLKKSEKVGHSEIPLQKVWKVLPGGVVGVQMCPLHQDLSERQVVLVNHSPVQDYFGLHF